LTTEGKKLGLEARNTRRDAFDVIRAGSCPTDVPYLTNLRSCSGRI
jgi:hypothetical protein